MRGEAAGYDINPRDPRDLYYTFGSPIGLCSCARKSIGGILLCVDAKPLISTQCIYCYENTCGNLFRNPSA